MNQFTNKFIIFLFVASAPFASMANEVNFSDEFHQAGLNFRYEKLRPEEQPDKLSNPEKGVEYLVPHEMTLGTHPDPEISLFYQEDCYVTILPFMTHPTVGNNASIDMNLGLRCGEFESSYSVSDFRLDKFYIYLVQKMADNRLYLAKECSKERMLRNGKYANALVCIFQKNRQN